MWKPQKPCSGRPLKESETVELKKSLAELKQGLVSMAAILNKHQAGTLWFGVRNNGAIAGIDANEKTLRDLSQSIAAHIEPKIFPRISEVTIDGKQCIKIEFAGDDTPYFAYGRAFMRVADEDRQLSVKRNPREIIIAALKKQPSISIRELSVQCDMSVHSVQHHINKLKEIGFIRHVGPTKAGRWEVVEDRLDASGDGGVGGGDE